MSKVSITLALLAQAQARDQEAAGQVVLGMEAHLKAFAKNFARRFPSLDMDDLLQEGRLAVLRAINRWEDRPGGADFKSYASDAILNIFRRLALRAGTRAGHEQTLGPEDLARATTAPEAGLDPDVFDQLDPLLARVLAIRLGPLLAGGKPLGWKKVGAKIHRTAAEAIALYEQAVAAVRAAHDD